MSDQNKTPKDPSAGEEKKKINRRDFLQGAATAPVLGLFGYALYKQQSYENAQKAALLNSKPVPSGLSDINVALLGVGAQGDVLLNAMLKIPGLKFRAVCDIWTDFTLKKAVNLLGKYKHTVNAYEDYREMLDKEKGLDAVVIATPDFWHAQHTIDCLKAGLHVYCEKEMSNTLEGARKMVQARNETGKLLQIGHQRRSHPKYLHCYEKVIQETKMLGRIATVSGQWNRAVQPDIGWPEKYAMPTDRLKKFGFQNMHQFRNWRWYKGLGGGPIVDLGSHQIDIYSWYLGSNPISVMASGGTDYYEPKTHEWYDTAMVVYEYDTPQGRARAFYQTQTTNSANGYFECFMGDQGTLVISEAGGRGSAYREKSAPAWDEWVQKGYIAAPKVLESPAAGSVALDVRETVPADEHKIPVELYDPYHKPHLENFFNAVRGNAKLNCPAEIGYETAVAVLKVNEAIEAGRKLTFDPKEFIL